ncbi:MAG: OmpA/MotB family protein [Desulfonatronovibrionaceae bacterium]
MSLYPIHSSGFSVSRVRQSRNQGGKAWAVPWSDLMMVMFILFSVLYMFHARENPVFLPDSLLAPLKGGAGFERDFSLDLDPIYQLARESLGNSSEVGLDRTEKGDLIISLPGKTFFHSGQTELNPDSHYYLREISQVIALAQGRVIVSGYAEQSEDPANQWKVSALRAAAIAARIQQYSGLNQDRIVVHGYGVSHPLVPDSQRIASELNRRVEIRILNQRP